MHRIALFFALAAPAFSTAQTPTWAGDIADIFYANCTSCHHAGGIGPFSLMAYDESTPYGPDIEEHVVADGHMPPWPPDTTFQRYAHERLLTASEVEKIHDWLEGGMPQGDLTTAPPPPVYSNEGFISLAPDLELTMPMYISQATATDDDYSCFSIPTGLTQDKKIRAFEVIPGNHAIVHHCLIHINASGTYPTNTSGSCTGPGSGLIGGYTPGSTPTVFPSNGTVNMGYPLPAGSNVVFAMHYPNYSEGQQDQTKIRFWFYPDDTPIREVSTDPILENWFFSLPANQETEVTANYNNVPEDLSVLSVFPHMHLIGKSIEAYGLDPEGDTLKFVRVPHWDFHWQQFFYFQHIIRVPQGSSMHSRGVYDNTVNNIHNPNMPPVNVGPGLNTTDEMFLVYFHYLPYEEGDELLDLEAMTTLTTSVSEQDALAASAVRAFPNPSSGAVNFEFDIVADSQVSLYLYDIQGRLAMRVLDNAGMATGLLTHTADLNGLPRGAYFASYNINGRTGSQKVVLD